MKSRVIIVFLLLLSLSALLVALGCAWNKGKVDIVYKVVINNPSAGVISISATMQGLSGSKLTISESIFPQGIELFGLSAFDFNNRPLKIDSAIRKRKDSGGEEKIYTVELNGKSATITYSVKLGAMGKHGHHGYLNGNFGLVSGMDIFLFPLKDNSLNRATVEFALPSGWDVVTTLKKEKDKNAFVIEEGTYRHKLNPTYILLRAVIGFGNFKMHPIQVDGFKIRIYVSSGWSNEHVQKIMENVSRLAKYQINLFNAKDKEWEYTAIFVPLATDKEGRVFAGCWSLGQGFEMPSLTMRNWELFSHRFHHVFNAFDPFGMYMSSKSEVWFLEATASYYELKSLAASGYYAVEERLLNFLKRDYDELRPMYDAPLAEDYKHSGETVEFLHYKKAPLVAYLIDKKIKEETKGSKDLDSFMKFIYAQHGMMKSPIKLKSELEQFTGVNFDSFFQEYVESAKPLELDFSK